VVVQEVDVLQSIKVIIAFLFFMIIFAALINKNRILTGES